MCRCNSAICPLVTVELAYGEKFGLDREDADILIQVRCPDVLWQKERLLNVGLDAVPSEVRKVVAHPFGRRPGWLGFLEESIYHL